MITRQQHYPGEQSQVNIGPDAGQQVTGKTGNSRRVSQQGIGSTASLQEATEHKGEGRAQGLLATVWTKVTVVASRLGLWCSRPPTGSKTPEESQLEQALLDRYVLCEDDVIACSQKLHTLEQRWALKVAIEAKQVEIIAQRDAAKHGRLYRANQDWLAGVRQDLDLELDFQKYLFNKLRRKKLLPQLAKVEQKMNECKNKLVGCQGFEASVTVDALKEQQAAISTRLKAAAMGKGDVLSPAERQALIRQAVAIQGKIDHHVVAQETADQMHHLLGEKRALERLIFGCDTDQQVRTVKHLGACEGKLARLLLTEQDLRDELTANQNQVWANLQGCRLGDAYQYMGRVRELRTKLTALRGDIHNMARHVNRLSKELGIRPDCMAVQTIDGKTFHIISDLKNILQQGFEVTTVYLPHGEHGRRVADYEKPKP